PVLPVGQAGAVALVRHEQVPQPVRLRALAQLHEPLGVGARGVDRHLLVEGMEQFHLDWIDVLLVELANAFEQALDLRSGVEVHAAAGYSNGRLQRLPQRERIAPTWMSDTPLARLRSRSSSRRTRPPASSRWSNTSSRPASPDRRRTCIPTSTRCSTCSTAR